MARIFQAEVQIIADDSTSREEVERQIERCLTSIKVCDVYLREVNYYGNIEEEPEFKEKE